MDQAEGLRKMVQIKHKKSFAGQTAGSADPHSPRVIAVTSGKGGVGKTNIVGNLAMAFSRLGKKVMILDADLGLANIDILFNLRPKYNIKHVLNGEKPLADVIIEGPGGIRIIPAGSGFADLTHLTEGQKLNLLSEFEMLDDTIDIFLIDTGAGISSNVLYFNLAADECILVATFEPTSITDAYAMMKVMYTEHGAKRFKLLVNMVNNSNEAKSVYLSLSQAIDRFINGVVIEYLGYIPRDERLRDAVLERKPVIGMYPEAISSKKIKAVAVDIINSPRESDSDGNIKFFLKRFMSHRLN